MTQITRIESKKEAFIDTLERHLLLPVDPHSADLFKALFDEFLLDFSLSESDPVAEQMQSDSAPQEEGLPSAEDLDAIASEQKAAE